MINRILLFGDTYGIPQLLKALPKEAILGIVGAENRPQYHGELKKLSEECGICFMIQPLPRSPDYPWFVRWLEGMTPDLIWINSYSMKLPEEVIQIPRFGALNIHGALLPQYRGCNPTQWAILNSEWKTGVTLHEVTARIDEGPIITQKEVPLYFEDTWIDIQKSIAKATDRLLEEIVPQILSGSWCSTPQGEIKAWYGRRRKPKDGCFSWNEPVIDIYNKIRALVAPHPGAFYEDTERGKTVIDEYMSLTEVVEMKYQQTSDYSLVQKQQLRMVFPDNPNDSTFERWRDMEWNGMEWNVVSPFGPFGGMTKRFCIVGLRIGSCLS